MKEVLSARKVVNMISLLKVPMITKTSSDCYCHMGATVVDAILQAGLNYKTVVKPRVLRVLEKQPNERTSSTFLRIARSNFFPELIDWHHFVKINRIREILRFFSNRKLETEKEVASWLSVSGNSNLLQTINGIGPKTVDYLANLVGLSHVAIDRHLHNFGRMAGVPRLDYQYLKTVMSYAADLMEVNRRCFDISIWKFMSSR
jgi:hypothetical protein